MRTRKAFTLIELLVVISILVLLMAILLPTLQQVRKQAKAAACQAKLRQWGIIFSMYMNDHNDQFDTHDGSHNEWLYCARPYYGECDGLFLCPMASRCLTDTVYSRGSKFTAWSYDRRDRDRKTPLYGSYGWTDFVRWTYCAHPDYRTRPLSARSSMPFLLDCVSFDGYTNWRDAPPAYDGDLSVEPSSSTNGMKWFCIDRHDGAINSLFLDWSVRRVGLKELWTLKWHGGWDTCGPWTKAGGVKAEDWPPWMRRFKDY